MSGHPISPDAKRIQVVAYWRLKTIENSKTTSRKIGRGRLHELVYERFQYKALTDNIFGVLGRWSLTGCGRLPDVVARGGSTVSSESRPLLEELPVVPL